MKIHLITIGQKPPAWVSDAYQSYAKRLPAINSLKLIELAPGPRKKQDVGREAAVAAVRKETQQIQAAIPKNAWVVALDERGQAWSTKELAKQLSRWRDSGKDVALLVGGADGLDAELRAQADQQWCLSPLTLPHAMVRVLLAEQLYRAHSILAGHPYHRE